MPPLTVDMLRSLFKNLQGFRALCEDEGKDCITSDDGVTWSLWDVEYLYKVCLERLPRRQAQAIELFLFHNMRESDVAKLMGLAPTNPIGMYATTGLEKLLDWIRSGQLLKFRLDEV